MMGCSPVQPRVCQSDVRWRPSVFPCCAITVVALETFPSASELACRGGELKSHSHLASAAEHRPNIREEWPHARD